MCTLNSNKTSQLFTIWTTYCYYKCCLWQVCSSHYSKSLVGNTFWSPMLLVLLSLNDGNVGWSAGSDHFGCTWWKYHIHCTCLVIVIVFRACRSSHFGGNRRGPSIDPWGTLVNKVYSVRVCHTKLWFCFWAPRKQTSLLPFADFQDAPLPWNQTLTVP